MEISLLLKRSLLLRKYKELINCTLPYYLLILKKARKNDYPVVRQIQRYRCNYPA